MKGNALVLDDIHDVDDYTQITIRALIDRIERSTTPEQFIYRETELDEMWRLVDIRLRHAEGAERTSLEALRKAIVAAHDLIGMDEKPAEAAQALRALG